MFRSRWSFPVVLGLLASSLVGFVTPAAAFSSVTQSSIVSAVPATNTPDAKNGAVLSITQVGTTMFMAGTFNSVSNHGSSTTLTVPGIAAFNPTTGNLIPGFAPTLNGNVQSIAPGPNPNTIYVAGNFTTANGQTTHVTLLNTADGSTVSTWKPSTQNGVIQKVVYSPNVNNTSGNGMVFIGGSFTLVGGVAHGALAALNPTTGKVISTYPTPSFSGHHNYNVNCSGSGCANGTIGIKDMDVDPSGNHLVAIGDFTSVTGDTSQHDQLALVDLGAGAATIDQNFQTAAYTAACFSGAFDSYVRGVSFSPDGAYFVVVATGGSGTNSDGTNSSCDTAARYETTATGSDIRPTWIDYTGQDTLLSTAITGGVVYVGGHERWLNNSKGYDYAGLGAIPRPGLAALNPVSGVPFSWNPGRSPRGAGTSALYPTSDGLWIGSDTDYIGPTKYFHQKLAFFPLAGGAPVPDESIPSLPGRVYTAGGFANTANSNVLYRINAAGPTIGATDNGPDWQGDQNDPSPYRNSQSNAASWGNTITPDSTVPASTPTAIFTTERWSPTDSPPLHWQFPVPAGDQVDVRLYFANNYDGTSQVGQRVFNVNVDGQQFLQNFDIVQAAGGNQRGTMRDEVVTSDGEVTVDLTHVTENPLINGIEIVKQSGPTNFTNPVPIYRIAAGGAQINATDSQPANWLADNADTTGDTVNGSDTTAFRSGGNVQPWDQPWGGNLDSSVPSYVPRDLFSNERWAPQTYTFPVAPGTPLKVNLFFANNCGCTNQPGLRKFNVSIDGNQVLGPDYDILSDVPDRTGEMKSFNVTAPNSGVVTVAVTNGSMDNAVINGLEVDQTAATPTGGATDIDRFSYRHFDGSTAGTEQSINNTGIAWGSIRGAFMVNGELYYTKTDGNFYERTFDGSTFGNEVLLDPYHDAVWDSVDTGSGQTYTGQPSDLSGSASSISSMFFTNGRLYYTLKGDSVMHWRWFEPEDGVVGSDSFTVNDGIDWSNVAGAFLSGNTLYFADRNSGALSAISWNGTQASGSPMVVDSSQDWAARGLFMLADATNPNQKPVADFTATCSATTTDCTFDAGASHDPDGSIADFGWDFGDTNTEHHPDTSQATHHYASAGPYQVTLTVTDNDGATASKTVNVVAGHSTPVPTFRGATTACGPLAGGACSTTVTRTDALVPTGTAAGDALLLFVSWPSATTTTASAPAGWHLLGTSVSSPLETDVYYRAAAAGDVNGSIPVTFSAKTRNSVTLADYTGADPNTIEAFAKSTDSNTASHTTPNAAVTQPGSLAVSYWSDKGSNTAWTPPGDVTYRASQYGAGAAGWPTAELADSGSTVGTGRYGSKTATTSVLSSKGANWTIVLAPAGSTNAPPSAAFTSNCTNLHCTFDASGSTDDGSIASYSWNYGDGSPASSGVSPSHDYASGGPYGVTLTVTDNQGATNSVTHTVNVSAPTQNIGFVGAAAKNGSAASETVTAPAATAAGDTLLLFASHASTTITSSAPGGWTLIGSNNASNLHTAIWEKTAVAGDAGSSVTVNFSAAVKGEVTIADYTNTAASPIEAIAGNTSGSGKNHTTPALSGLTNNSWVVSFWTDKSTTTTSWTAPGSVTKRQDTYGTGTGVVSALLADSNAGVSGSYPAQTATTDATSGSSSQWTIALSPKS